MFTVATFINDPSCIWITCGSFYRCISTCCFTLHYDVMEMASFLKPHEQMSAIFQLFFGSILPFPSLQRMEKHSGLPLGFSGGSVVKDFPASAEDTGDVGFCLSQEDPLEEGMATHPFHCLENPMDRRTSWFTVHRVAKTQTRWK